MQALPLSPATTYTLNFTRPATLDSTPEVTALAVSLNGTNTTLFELPANGTSFTAHLGRLLFDGEASAGPLASAHTASLAGLPLHVGP